MADLISLIVVLVVIGVVLWLVDTKVPMDPTIKTVIRVIVILAFCLWLLNYFGIYSGFPHR